MQVPRPKLSEEDLEGMYMLGAFAETDIEKGTIVARGTGFFWHKAYPLSKMGRPRKGMIEHLAAGVYAVDMPNMYGNAKESTLLFVLNASSPLSLINSFKGIGTKNASLCQCTYPDENGVHRPTLQLAVEMDSDIKANTQVFVDYGMHFEFHKGTPPEFQKEHVESFCKDVNPATGRLFLNPVDYESEDEKKEEEKKQGEEEEEEEEEEEGEEGEQGEDEEEEEEEEAIEENKKTKKKKKKKKKKKTKKTKKTPTTNNPERRSARKATKVQSYAVKSSDSESLEPGMADEDSSDSKPLKTDVQFLPNPQLKRKADKVQTDNGAPSQSLSVVCHFHLEIIPAIAAKNFCL